MIENAGSGRRGRADLATAALVAGVLAAVGLAGCGGGGGASPKPVEAAPLYVKTFSVPNYSGIYMDEDVSLVLSAPVREDSINPDSFRMRTGIQGGIAPYGTYVRGAFMIDPNTGNRVVINHPNGGLSDSIVARVEKGRSSLDTIPATYRIDLGYDEPQSANGNRTVLFDRTQKNVVTFIPEIPTRAALDDTGLAPGVTYQVIIPGYPSTNTLENLSGGQLLSPNNRIFTSSFSVVPSTAPQLFLGAESTGIPRVIHSDPFNGKDQVAVTSTIAIRFSQPLDPRTVTPDKFKVELISVAAPYPIIPVSVFLAQQRLGKVEVILTPINPMPANGAIRVTMDPGIEDLRGQAINQSVISFYTGVGQPVKEDFLEDFSTVNNLEGGSSTAVWNANKPFVGAKSGFLTAAFAPYAGDGTDGAFSAPIGQNSVLSSGTVSQRVYNFTTFSVPIGGKLTVTGNFPLVIHCQGQVDIAGEIHLDASDGGHGYRGDDVGNLVATGGAGGAAGPGGNRGGDGAMATIGGGGNFDGLDGQGPGGGIGGNTGENDGGGSITSGAWPRLQYPGGPSQCAGAVPCSDPPKNFDPMRKREGGGGGGFSLAGGNSGNAGGTLIRRGGAAFGNGGFGGPVNGVSDFSNASSAASVQVKDPANPPNGLRTITLNGIPTLVAGQGGSGGGGGGGEDDSQGDTSHWGVPDGSDEGGGGGGGGGGAFQIISYTTINLSGILSAKGGNGGSSFDDLSQTQFSQGAGGGGGSGGAVWLQCRGSMTVQPGTIIDVSGGTGGQGFADGTTAVFTGGNGAAGRIRLDDSDGNIVNAPAAASTGTFVPALDLDSVAFSQWQDTHFFTPDFQAPIIMANTFAATQQYNGSIKIYMEATQEDVLTAVDDPDLSKSTGFQKVFDSTTGGLATNNPWDLLDNNKWWRFKVEFHVDPLHTFTDPLPEIDSINFQIKQ